MNLAPPAAIEPSHFCQSVLPLRYEGSHRGQRLRFLHAHINPLPELPALTHAQEVWCAPDHLVPPHIHATHEITYVISGRGHWQVEEQNIEVSAGDLWVARPGELHAGGADPDDPYRIFVLGIAPEAVLCGDNRRALEQQRVARRRRQGALLLNEPARKFEPAREGAPYDFGALDDRVMRGTSEIALGFKRLLRELDEAVKHPMDAAPRTLGVLMIRALLVELFVQIARAQTQITAPKPRFEALCQWLQNCPHAPPSVAEMAALVGLSPAHFAAQFKRETGRTPHDYLLDCRIEAAARWLRADQSLSVSRVALDLGFSSSQYFSVAFRARKNCTPGQWRRGKAAQTPENRTRAAENQTQVGPG